MSKENICPICGALPSENQPYPGTHGYTVLFECGTEIDRAYGYEDYESFSQKCDQPRKLTNKEIMDKIIASDKKRKWESIKFEHWADPQSEIHKLYEIFGYMVKALNNAKVSEKGCPTITAPDLLKSVLKQGEGHLNPTYIIELINKLNDGKI